MDGKTKNPGRGPGLFCNHSIRWGGEAEVEGGGGPVGLTIRPLTGSEVTDTRSGRLTDQSDGLTHLFSSRFYPASRHKITDKFGATADGPERKTVEFQNRSGIMAVRLA